jgi:hypothetical protein
MSWLLPGCVPHSRAANASTSKPMLLSWVICAAQCLAAGVLLPPVVHRKVVTGGLRSIEDDITD